MSKLIIVTLIQWFILNWFFISVCQSEKVIIPGIGTITGTTGKTTWTNQTIYEFLAVRYAISPSKNLRFKLPVSAVTQEEKEILAEKHGFPCPRYYDIVNLPEEDLTKDLEDCLHLSIYTKNVTSKTPVMVFIHGGGLENGNSKEFSGESLLEKDVILVSIQYRLGPLGFMTTKTEDMPENLGFHDSIMALEWIKTYIQYFGGDPNRITAFGCSAGAMIVSALLLSEKVPENLFQNAIIQSGSYFVPWGFNSNPLALTKEVVKFTNCEKKETPAEIYACFKDLSVINITKAYKDHVDDKYTRGVSPYPSARLVESSILPISPSGYIAYAGPVKNISVMAGVTKHDGVFFGNILLDQINRTVGLDDPNYISYNFLDRYLQDLGISDYTASIKGYLQAILFDQEIMINGNFSKLVPGLKDLVNTVAFKAPTFKAVQIQAKVYPEKTFLYSFDYEGNYSILGPDLHPLLSNGVHHGDELIYLFPYFPLHEKDQEISERMIDLWTTFATDGIPKADGIPEWIPVTKLSGPYMHIDEVSYIGKDFLDEYTVITDQGNGLGAMQKSSIFTVFLGLVVLSINKIIL